MNVGNGITAISMEGKSQISFSGKPEGLGDKQPMGASELVENGISLNQSLFKSLLLNNKMITKDGLKGNPSKTETLIEESSLEETNQLVSNGGNLQAMSLIDLKMLLSSSAIKEGLINQNSINNKSLNVNELTLKQNVVSANIEAGENEQVAKLGKTGEGVNLEANKATIKIVAEGKADSYNGTFIKNMKGTVTPASRTDGSILVDDQVENKVNLTGEQENSTNGIENKGLNQEKQAIFKSADLTGIEKAIFSNNKEINMEKLEKLAAIRDKNEEKPESLGEGENQVTMNKQGNLVNDQIELNLKNQKLENVPVYNQIAEEIALKIEQKGPMEFKLQLKPENLGEIDICIKVVEGKLSIDIISANAKTQDLLVSQVDKLVTKLGLQNFQIENVQVSPVIHAASQDTTSQTSLINLGMSFSERRQQETLKEQNGLKKGLNVVGSVENNEKETNNTLGILSGQRYMGHKVNYSF